MAQDAPEDKRRRTQEAHRDAVLQRLRRDLHGRDAFGEAVYPQAGLEAEVVMRSRWRISLFHPLRSVYVRDSHEATALAALPDVEKHWRFDAPSLDLTGVLKIEIRRVHEDDEVGA